MIGFPQRERSPRIGVRIIVVGSRGLRDYKLLDKHLCQLTHKLGSVILQTRSKSDTSEVFDELVQWWAWKNWKTYEVYWLGEDETWEDRNRMLLRAADRIILFLKKGDSSPEIRDLLKRSKKFGLKIKIIKVKS